MGALDQIAAQNNLNLNSTPSNKGGNLDQIEQQMNASQASSNAASSGASSSALVATDPGSFMTAVDNFNRMFGRPAEAVLDGTARLAGDQNMVNQIGAYTKAKDQEASDEMGRHPIAGGIGIGAGIAGQAAVLGAAGAGSGLLANAGIGTLYGFLGSPGTFDQRMTNGTIGGLLGGAGSLATKGIGMAAKDVGGLLGADNEFSGTLAKTFSPENSAAKDVSNVVQTKSDIQDLIKGLVPDGVDAATSKINAGYEALKPANVSPESAQQLLSNPSIAERLQTVNNSVDSSMKNLPDTSMAKLASVSKMMGDELYNDTAQLKNPGMKTLNPDDLPTLMAAKNQINDILDKEGQSQGIDYQSLRQAAEKKILYNQYSNALAKTPELKGAAPMFGDPTDINTQNIGIGKLYDTLAGNQQKQTYFIDAMQSAGADVDNAKELLTKLGSLEMRNNPVEGLLNSTTKEAGFSIGSEPSATIAEWGKDFLKKITMGQYNDSVVKLMLSGPKLQGELSSILNTTGNTFASGLKDLLTKVGGATSDFVSHNPIAGVGGGLLASPIQQTSAGQLTPNKTP
jgi:hypothetical protein